MKPSEAAEPEAPAREQLTVRPATIEDAGALARLSVQLGYPTSREQVESRLGTILGKPEHAVLVAEVESGSDGTPKTGPQVVAWIHGFVQRVVESDPTVQLGGLVVDEAWRGRGAGRLLLEHVERWACSVGCATVTVRSNVIREQAHEFYQKMGYNAVKVQRVVRKQVAI